jgi:hypothetical protein
MPVVIERCRYQVGEHTKTQKDEAKRRMEEPENTNRRAIINSCFLLVVAPRIYQHDKQGCQPCTGHTCIHHDVRRNPELIAPDYVMPPPIPSQAEFCEQEQAEYNPGTHLADSTLGIIGSH